MRRRKKRTLLHEQPATEGPHRRSGARQSTPSISIDSCSELSATVSPGSTSGGHRKTPCSSRLVKRHRPVPSQYTILIRWAWDGGTRTDGPRTGPAAIRPAPTWRARRRPCAYRCSPGPSGPSDLEEAASWSWHTLLVPQHRIGRGAHINDLHRDKHRCIGRIQLLLPTEQHTRRYPIATRHLGKTR